MFERLDAQGELGAAEASPGNMASMALKPCRSEGPIQESVSKGMTCTRHTNLRSEQVLCLVGDVAKMSVIS